MAFAAAVMSTSAGHRAFTRSPSSDAIISAQSQSPSTPTRVGTASFSTAIPRSMSNNSNSSSSNINTHLNTSYIDQFNTSLSSFNPRPSPPTPQQNAISFQSTTTPESPHMIRCSTCNAQVPLVDLCDHICRPSPQATASSLVPPPRQASAAAASQHSRLASGFNHNAAPSPPPSHMASRNMLNPLRVNISHAPPVNGQFDSGLPTPYRTPLPRSPSSASYSPSNHSHSQSPGTSPAGTSLSPAYPYEQSQPHQRYPSSDAENDTRRGPPSPNNQGYFEQNQHTNALSQSPSARSDIDLSGENNAGIGARMPFYERLQQQRGLNSPATSPSLSPGGLSPVRGGAGGVPSQYSPPLSAGPQQQTQPRGQPVPYISTRQEITRMADLPKSPISPGWSGLANEEPEIFQRFEQPRHSEEGSQYTIDTLEEEEENVYQRGEANPPPKTALQQAKDNGQKIRPQQQQPHHVHANHQAHMRETSDSGQSSAMSNSYSDHLDYLIKDDSTPETSPEFPDTPLFKEDTSVSGYSGPLSRSQLSQSSSQQPFEHEEEDDGYHGYADDIIDSYPTPQQTFSGRFGELVIDDTASEPYHNRAQAARPSEQQAETIRERLIPSPEPVPLSSPLLRTHSDRTHQEASFPFKGQLGRGLPSSHSTPNNLSRLAGIDTSLKEARPTPRINKVDESAIPFMQRRRLHSEEKNLSGSISPSLSSKSLKKDGIAPSPTTENSGVCLDACLDDLLKEMNRESIETLPAVTAPSGSGSRSPLSPIASSSHSATPTSPGPSYSNSKTPFKAPTRTTSREKIEVQCDSCNLPVRVGAPVERDGQSFCGECYAQLYLPKCRKCRLPIEDKAIGSGDGKVKGKFHIGCFSCFSCSAPFPTGDFYVYGNRPYCAQHYHERNGTLCANPDCLEEQRGIEGPCVSLAGEESGNGGRYHPTCFKCSHSACDILLDQYHYVLSGLPYCEHHANELEEQDNGITNGTSRSVSPPRNVENDDFYDARQGASANVTTSEQRRRSVSLDAPVPSLNQLRKNAQAPNYRGILARRRSSARRRPSESQDGWNNASQNHLYGQQGGMRMGGGPPPVSKTRRAEKRRTVISQIRLH